MSQSTRITELANIISDSTTIVNDYFESRGLPTPSFDVSGPSRIDFPPQEKQIADARMRVLEATDELHRLMQGPTAMVMEISVRKAPFFCSKYVDDVNIQARRWIVSVFTVSMPTIWPALFRLTKKQLSKRYRKHVV
jgi:hypothetical protein